MCRRVPPRAGDFKAARNFEARPHGKFRPAARARRVQSARRDCRRGSRPVSGEWRASRLWRRAPCHCDAARPLSRPLPFGPRQAQERADERAEQAGGDDGVGVGESVEQRRQEHRCREPGGEPAQVRYRAPGPAAMGAAQNEVGRHHRHQTREGQSNPRRHLRHETRPETVHRTNFPLAQLPKELGDSQRESVVRKRKVCRRMQLARVRALSARERPGGARPCRSADFQAGAQASP
jgi:hypothetical protein